MSNIFVNEAIVPEAPASSPLPNPRTVSAPPPLGHGMLAMVDALLKSPASVLHGLRESRGSIWRFATIVVIAMLVTGFVCGSIGGGTQLFVVPAKLALGLFFSALICLPSLHIFSCLAGAEQSAKETSVALLMGIGLVSVLLVGFAPVAWIFAQATASLPALGALYIAFMLISVAFGLRLIHRALVAVNVRPVGGIGLWGALFVIVLLQMTTTLRPLVGPSDGAIFHERMFFLTHWVGSVVR